MQFLDTGLELVRKGASYRSAAEQIVQRCVRGQGNPAGIRPPVPYAGPARRAIVSDGARTRGGGRAHPDDSCRGERCCTKSQRPRRLPVNIDGAIAAVCGDIGIPPTVANALFIISRVPGHRGARRRRARASAADAPDRSEGPHLRRPVRTPAAGEAQVGSTVKSVVQTGWALGSVVEHRLHTAGVDGSNPSAPTNFRGSLLDGHAKVISPKRAADARRRTTNPNLRSRSQAKVVGPNERGLRSRLLGLCRQQRQDLRVTGIRRAERLRVLLFGDFRLLPVTIE